MDFEKFLGDFDMKALAGTWLQYEQYKRVGDAMGQSQEEVYNTPPRTQQVNTAQNAQLQTVAGISLPVLVVGGVLLYALLNK
ncbi:hypothetical protein V9J68_001860 [Vibrio cholerae]